ncbi:MAG: FagA protein [Pseudomonas sp.]
MASTQGYVALTRWQWLGDKIRWALEPNEPRLIEDYLRAGHQLVKPDEPGCWHLTESEFHLLLESAADPNLPWHWRCLCLDHCHRPLNQLQALSSTGERRRRLDELRVRLSTLRLRPSIAMTEGSLP